jgi:hypothetical protein
MLLFHKFMSSVSEWTRILEVALANELPVSAHLCLELHLILPDEIFSLFLIVEMSLGLLYCRELIGTLRWLFLFSRRICSSRTRGVLSNILGWRMLLFVISCLSWTIWVIVKWLFTWTIQRPLLLWNFKVFLGFKVHQIFLIDFLFWLFALRFVAIILFWLIVRPGSFSFIRVPFIFPVHPITISYVLSV